MRIRATFDKTKPPVAAVPQSAARRDVRTTIDATPAAMNLALAHRIARLIDQGQIADYTAAARLIGVSQPRLTHLMGLLLLAPEIQAAILAGTIAPTDKQLRQLARVAEWSAQFELLARFADEGRAKRRTLTTTAVPSGT